MSDETSLPDKSIRIELDSRAVIEAYPQLRELPPSEAQVIMLYAAGMTQKQIAAFLDITQRTVEYVLSKHDITKIIRKGVEMQKLFLANSVGTVMMQAIAEIKKKTDEFQKMPVAQLMNLIRSCVDVQKHLSPPEKEKTDDSADLLTALRESAPKVLDTKPAS